MPFPVHGEDLLSLYAEARHNDPTFLSAIASHLAARERLAQARGALLPNISVSGESTRMNARQTVDEPWRSELSGKARIKRTGYAVILTQPLYDARRLAGLDHAQADVRQAVAMFAAEEQDLAVRLAEAYFNVQVASDAVELAIAEKSLASRQMDSASARYRAGLAIITDTYDARARLEFASAQLIDSQNALENQRDALREITYNQVPTKLARLRDTVSMPALEPMRLEDWLTAVPERNLRIKAAEATAEIARAEIQRQRAGHQPTLELVGQITYSDDDRRIEKPHPGVRNELASIGVQLTVPLFQGGTVQARVRESRHQFEVAQQDVERQRRNAARSTRAAFLAFQTAPATLEALRQAMRAGESALEAKTKGFNAGLSTNIDVLNAQKELFSLKRNLTRARYDHLLNFLHLQQAVGGLDESALTRINDLLE